MNVFIDLSGREFGKWKVIKRHPSSINTYWECECICGKTKLVTGCSLVAGNSTNCGCSRKKGNESHSFKHGLKGNLNYQTWLNMINRVENPRNKDFHAYGGRGITIFKEWRESILRFNQDVGERPTPKHSLDRIDVNGNYEPGNVRWATRKEQANNRRTNVVVSFEGEQMSLIEACKKAGVGYGAAKYRISVGKDWKGEPK